MENLLAFANQDDFKKAVELLEAANLLPSRHESVFGVTMWTEEDISSRFEELHDTKPTTEQLDEIMSTHAVRHIDDCMVESGWDAIELGIEEVMSDAS